MSSIIDQLFMNYEPFITRIPPAEYKAALQKLNECFDKQSELTQKEFENQLSHAYSDMEGAYANAAFREGFLTGARLMLEISEC